MKTIKDFRVGQIIYIWVYTGTKNRVDSYDPLEGKIIKIGKKKIKVELINGSIGWVYPDKLDIPIE